MELTIKYLKRFIIFIVLVFISIFIYFWNTSEYEYSSPGDDPEYVDKVIYRNIGYDVISLSCAQAFFPTLIVEDDYIIYVAESIYESPGIMMNPEVKGIVYINNNNFDTLLNDFKNLANCSFGFDRDDFIDPINNTLKNMKRVTGTADSIEILRNIYYCTDQWERGVFGNPDFEFRQLYYGTNKNIIRCEI
jgi:hypothetical protein